MDQSRRRRPIRLPGYDYSQPGAYFITICAHQRAYLFGHITESEMQLYQAGRIAAACWREIPVHFPTVALDQWIMMPNHLHGILIISFDDLWAGHAPPLPGRPAPGIATIVGSFKSAAAKRINEIRATPGAPVWQRNYYEHVVRDEGARASANT